MSQTWQCWVPHHNPSTNPTREGLSPPCVKEELRLLERGVTCPEPQGECAAQPDQACLSTPATGSWEEFSRWASCSPTPTPRRQCLQYSPISCQGVCMCPCRLDGRVFVNELVSLTPRGMGCAVLMTPDLASLKTGSLTTAVLHLCPQHDCSREAPPSLRRSTLPVSAAPVPARNRASELHYE